MGERLPPLRELMIPALYVLCLGFVFLAAYLFLGTADPRGPDVVPTPGSQSGGR